MPSIGGQLRKPFDAVSASLTDVISSANDQVASIERLASWSGGWVVFGMPVTMLLACGCRGGSGSIFGPGRRGDSSTRALTLTFSRCVPWRPNRCTSWPADERRPGQALADGDATGDLTSSPRSELRSTGLRLPEGLAPGSPLAKDDLVNRHQFELPLGSGIDRDR